ncbi:hypothetical protein VE03_06436 [Pseudogymnoascus sp. 23342-1-I1]|nr:hypothetical protein VE03_06436 [Pseudogymnoascus sp. 23342-1-I1]
MSPRHLASGSNLKSPSNTLDAHHVRKKYATAPQTTRTEQYSSYSFYDLPPSAKVLRATGNHNHTCTIHGRGRATTADPSAPVMPLTAPTHFYGLPTPPGVIRATSVGSSGATRRYTSRRSPRESLEEAFYDCQETSLGFLTPSLNQSHSGPPSRDDDDPTEDAVRFLCCYIPKIHLPQLQPIPCWGFSLAKGEPMTVGGSSHVTHAELPPRVWRKKSASVANDETMRYVGITEPAPTTAISSASMIRGDKVESFGRSNSTVTVCRNALFTRGRRTGTVSEMAINRNSQGNVRHQMKPPTIVTLQRAIADLNTLVHPRIHAFSADMNNSAILRVYRRSIRSMALPAECLTTSEEIRSLKSLIKSKFFSSTPKQTALVKKSKSSSGLGWREGVKKSTSESVVWFGAPHKTLQPRGSLSVSKVHTAPRSIVSRERRRYFMSQISQGTSVISMLMKGKSIQEMVWGDDGKPQNLFSSTWSLATSLAQGDLATWSRRSYRRDLSPAPIKDKAPYGGGTAITGIKRTFKTVWEHRSEMASETPYDINKSLALSEVRIPSYVTQQFSICTPKPISDGVWLPPISIFDAPLMEIPAANLSPSLLDSSCTDMKDYHAVLNPQPKHPLLESPVVDASGKPALTTPVAISQPSPPPWGNFTHSLVRVPVGSRTKPSLWSSDVAASGQMTATRGSKESTAENTPRLWKRSSARRLRSALGMGSGESWRRVAGVENIKDAETMMGTADDRAPWGTETLDDVSIISEDVESDSSSRRGARSLGGKRGLLRRISQKAGRARKKFIAVREEKYREGTEDGKYREGGTESDCPSEKTVDQRGTLEEKSKYDELEDWVCGLSEAMPILRPHSSKNYISLYGGSRATDLKIGDNQPLKLEGKSRRSVSITTIV